MLDSPASQISPPCTKLYSVLRVPGLSLSPPQTGLSPLVVGTNSIPHQVLSAAVGGPLGTCSRTISSPPVSALVLVASSQLAAASEMVQVIPEAVPSTITLNW